ncbi:HYDIN protein, partial [Ptilonorhynchus violaceus]|nr:HYDIN protein [Ptilonorhynchus violaceus]
CSSGKDATVVVKNPCKFPIEFYSVDFDEQYLEEEKVRRQVWGCDSPKTFWLPPRAAGETLPPEVLQYWEAQKRLKAQQAEAKARAEAEAEAKAKGKVAPAQKNGRKSVKITAEPVVEVIENPITRALERHLGVNRSPEAHEALMRKGIVLIVHGAPVAGKTATAAALGAHYGALCLSIDTVVKEAIANN